MINRFPERRGVRPPSGKLSSLICAGTCAVRPVVFYVTGSWRVSVRNISVEQGVFVCNTFCKVYVIEKNGRNLKKKKIYVISSV